MIRVTISGLTEARVRVDKMIQNQKNLQPALLKAGDYALGVARARIERGGDPAWPANIGGTHLLMGDGRLINSLQPGGPGNIQNLSGNQIRIGTNVFYARWLQEGTGIYGERGTPIVPLRTAGFGRGSEHVPRSKLQGHVAAQSGIFGDPSVLAFKIGGKMRFFKSVKGSPKRPYLYFDDKDVPNIARIIGNYLLAKDKPPEAL